jgi:hypothetical protein
MAVNSRLFEMLAEAGARPSKAFQGAQAAINAGNEVAGNLTKYGNTIKRESLLKKMLSDPTMTDQQRTAIGLADSEGQPISSIYEKQQETRLKPYEIYAKISDSAGPDVANSIFKQAGMPIPDMARGSPAGTAGGTAGVDGVVGNPGKVPGPKNYTPEELSGMGTFGQKKLTGMKTVQDLQSTAPVEFGQVQDFFASAGRPEIGQSLVTAAQRSGKTTVQKDIFDKATALVGPRSDIADALNKRTDLQVANAINHNVNAMTASGVLGQSGKNNIRIARIQPLLQKNGPLTPQELERVNTDIDGVITGGVPLQSTEQGQKISTVATEIARLKQQFGNNPQAFNDAGFRQRMIPLVNGLIAADNEVQDQAYKMVQANYGHLTTPEHLVRVKQALATGQQLPIVDIQGGGTPGGEIPGGGTGDPEADAAIQQVMSSAQPTGKKQAAIAAIKARSGR